MSKKFLGLFTLVLILSFVLAACGSEEPEMVGNFQIPAPEDGKYNVAFVYVGPHDDNGWSQSHDAGRMYVEENVADVHTAYVENVPEGADAEQVIRSLARKGFDVIFTTSFGFMDASEAVAEEFPDVDIIHVSGYKANGENFGNLMGAMEDMKYLAGMLAGSRALMTGIRNWVTWPPSRSRKSCASVTPLRWVCRRPARSARLTCASSTPGTTRSWSRKALSRSSPPVRRS